MPPPPGSSRRGAAMTAITAPRPVVFVLRSDFLLIELAAVAEPLRLANEHGATPRFALRYVAASPAVVSSLGIAVSPVEPLPAALPDDAIVVLVGTRAATLERNRRAEASLVRWLAAAVRPSHLVLCVCTGALLAAQAGLLDGRACTTHHDYCARLAAAHPRARVHDNRIFVRDGNVFSSAGVTAGIDLTLFVIGLLCGEPLALAIARDLVLYLRRAGDDPQLSPLLAHRNHLHPRIHGVQDAIVKQPNARWSLRRMAKLVHMSPRQLTRVFPACTGTTPAAYVKLIRIGRARELLDTSALAIERVAEHAGFGSVRQFRRAFAAHYGEPPSRWRVHHRG
jgi:transcriptional regulator GlxA family with amidase domain